MVNIISLNKTQIEIMKLFVSNINENFTINGVSRCLDMNVSLTHRMITPLIKEYKLIELDKKKLISLNYENNHGTLAFIENIRSQELLNKKEHKIIKEFLEEIMDKLKDEYFIIILFGSAVTKTNPRDRDVLFIFENYEKVEKRERTIKTVASNHSDRFDITVISVESIYEMASKRKQKNVLNELLNKHIILYGGENFYRLIKNARQ